MIRGGLVSITFRKLSIFDITSLVMKSGLKSIEWGGDVHVPHGDIKKAYQAFRVTDNSGLKVACYGSYYRAGETVADSKDSFESVLDTAIALQAPIIRVWAGKKSSEDADSEYRKHIIDDSLRIAELAAAANIKISYEYHNNTLTDNAESVQKLMQEITHSNIYFHWQPNQNRNHEAAVTELQTILPRLSILHIFKWKMVQNELIKCPLAEGNAEWHKYFNIANSKNETIDALIEFVKDDSPEQFLEDAKALLNLIDS